MPLRRATIRGGDPQRRPKYLFAENGSPYALTLMLRDQLRKELNSIPQEKIFGSAVDTVINEIVARFTLNVPVLDLKAIEEFEPVATRMQVPQNSEFGFFAAAKLDVFLSHASEDEDTIARPLYDALVSAGIAVWFDEAALVWGDSLRRKIEDGLARCKYGVVIISPNFLSKEWPQRELDGLAAREIANGKTVILPIWHDIDQAGIAAKAPMLADRLAVRSTVGVGALVEKVRQVLSQ